MMFIVLSHVIETITGSWLGEYLQEKIWGPLGMDSTFFSLEDAKKAAERNPSMNLAIRHI
jgi:hypothetical protein